MAEPLEFTGEANFSEIIKGIDGMTAAFQKAKASGDVSNETLDKMEAAITSVNDAALNLQKTTGKGIAPSFADGKMVQQVDNLKESITGLNTTVNKYTADAKAKLAELQTQQTAYKNSIKEINDAIKANEKEYASLSKEINKLITAGKGASVEVVNLRKQLRDNSNSTQEFRTALAGTQKGLIDTTSAIKIQSVAVKDAEKATSGFASGLTKAYSGLRTLANILPGIGIGGLVALIAGPLVDAFTDWVSAIDKSNKAIALMKQNQANLNEVVATANKSAGEQISTLKILYQAATDANLPIKERKKAVDELQQQFPDYFKNIKDEIILNGGAKDAYDRLTASIIATSRAKAAKGKIDELEARRLDSEFQKQKIINATANEAAKAQTRDLSETASGRAELAQGRGATPTLVTKESQLRIIAARKKKALDLQDITIKSLQDQEDFLVKFVGLGSLAKVIEDKTKDPKQKKAIENIYERELTSLRADLAKITEKGFTDEATITAAIEADFKKRDLAFQKAFRNKKLTAGQLQSLEENLANLQTLTLKKSLDDFGKQKAAYLQKISDELADINAQEAVKRVSLLKDDFERERQTIISESDKTITALQKARDGKIEDLQNNAAKNGVTPAQLKPQTDAIKEAYSKLFEDLNLIKEQKLQQLSFDTFEKLSTDAKRVLTSGNLGISTGSLVNIQDQTAQFQTGKISYKQYQEALTKIARNEANERYSIEKLFLQSEINIRQEKLANDKELTDTQITKLKDEIVSLQQQLNDATKGNLTSNAADDNALFRKRIDTIVEYASAIGNLTQSIIGFWQQSNEVEARALSRSIALQDRRVAAAQRIAERGNAEYLRLEEERLQQLLIKQENAARRTLAINAALQASQLLVALITGIAKGAEIGGPIGAIISVAAIAAAIAGAFAIAQSLKPVQPTFFVGTEDTGRGGSVDGKGGFHAILHPNERVVSAEENKKMKGISNKDLANLVHNWRTMPEPMLNTGAMEMATSIATGEPIRAANIVEASMKENILWQKKVYERLGSIGMSINMDRHGFAASFMETAEQMNKDKKL